MTEDEQMKRVKAKWIYMVWTDYKRVLTNKRSCPNCGEYRKIEKLVSFVMHPQMGIFKPYRCKSCGFHIDVATGKMLDHINKVGRDYPLDRTIHPDVPLWGEEKEDSLLCANCKETETDDEDNTITFVKDGKKVTGRVCSNCYFELEEM